jgi:hypothetical protein
MTSILSHLQEQFQTRGSASGSGSGLGALVQAVELLIPSLIRQHGGEVTVMPPAPRVVPIYFPQYHAIPENDRFWSPGFTEWTLLRKANFSGVRKPLPPSEGGLGYYTLTDREVRAQQRVMAQTHGVHGCMYYHYWFSGKKAPRNHKVMYKIPELMLQDGEPALPFMFSWANEPWTVRWTGQPTSLKDTLLSQGYGDKTEWEEHFQYLLQFFKHPNYIQIEGKPVFVLYRVGLFAEKLQPMLQLWNKLAVQNGFAGVHIIGTIGGFYKHDKGTQALFKLPEVNSAFHFWPIVNDCCPDVVYGGDEVTSDIPQFWGAYTGFDARPRRPKEDKPRTVSPPEFEQNLRTLFHCPNVTRRRSKAVEENFIFVTAWNEWNEQAVMEPNSVWGNGYLEALKAAVESVPSCPAP